MNNLILTPEILTAENFSQFGQVISLEQKDFLTINDGYAKKYPDLATIDTQEHGGTTTVHIYVAKKRQFPLQINMLEKHPFFSQTFIPKDNQPFLVVVAPASDEPNIKDIRAFISNGEQGVNYSRGVWHFPLISVKDGAQFIVIDRKHVIDSDDIEQCIVHPIEDSNITLEFSL
jgi:ureidoglycolate lyase